MPPTSSHSYGGNIAHSVATYSTTYKHVLITSAAVSKSGTVRTTHFALICNSSIPIKMGGHVFRFANRHYKNISKHGTLGKTAEANGPPAPTPGCILGSALFWNHIQASNQQVSLKEPGTLEICLRSGKVIVRDALKWKEHGSTATTLRSA